MTTFDLNIFQLIILILSVQGLIFGLIILCKKRFRIKSNVLLGLMVILLAISNFQHILIDMNYLDENSILRKIYIPFQWLFMPLLYLHIKESLNGNSLNSKGWSLLFGPFLLVSLTHITHFIYNVNFMSISSMPDFNTAGLLLYSNLGSFVFNIIIAFAIFNLIAHYEKSFDISTVKNKKLIIWYKNLIKATLATIAFGIVTIYLILWFGKGGTNVFYPFFILVSAVLYYVGYVGVNRTTPLLRQQFETRTSQRAGNLNFEKIVAHIEEEKPYLNQAFSLKDIASKFNLSTGYVSQLFSTHGKQNFNDYTNELRIKTSKKMLLEKKFENYTIESIGQECGFKSKSNFYTAFKKFSGQTPTEYIKTQEKRPVS